MSALSVNLVSAFGRGETLALALHEAGFQVQVLDFTDAFPAESHRGVGPFPVVHQAFHPMQNEFLKEAKPLTQGLSFWLKDGPLELSGPLAAFQAQHQPALRDWLAGKVSSDFSTDWLRRFLLAWTSPYLFEAWDKIVAEPFPAGSPLSLVPEARETAVTSFARVHSKGVEVHRAQSLSGVVAGSSRVQQVEASVSGIARAFSAAQWVWCLSSSETKSLGKEAAAKLFWRGIWAPEWVYLSFEGQMQKGSWADGLPPYCVVIGDVYLPWAYANTFVLRRVDETRCRFWLKVPTQRAHDIDARRAWASEVQKLLAARLSLAEWKVDSSSWSLCPQSVVFSSEQRDEALSQWKNWDWIAPETLARLDVSARLARESAALRRLVQWRNEQMRKQGAPRDHALHAP